MKSNLLLIILLTGFAMSKTLAQECLPDGILFSSQAQIDRFPLDFPGCVKIIGEVKIKEDVYETISNLRGLSQITSIDGNLYVLHNDSLKSLNGLENLQAIGGNCWIYMNASLTDLQGLDHLSSVGGYLKVHSNVSLTSLSGLDNLTSVEDYILVNNNRALLRLNGLERLDSVRGDLGINNNESLPSLNGLNNLTYIGRNLQIANNLSLTTLRGLENMATVGGFLSVKENTNLTSLEGLNNLTSIQGALDISDNASLKNLQGINNLTSIGGYLKVQKNASLTSLSGLDSLGSVGGDVDVYDNTSLIKLNELENLDPAGRMIRNNRTAETYKMWVTSMDHHTSNYRGYLMAVEDSAIVLSHTLYKTESGYQTKHINIRGIGTIKLRQKGQVVKSILLGAVSGFVFGTFIGQALGDDVPGQNCSEPDGSIVGNLAATWNPCRSAKDKSFLLGWPMGITGALVGGIAGSAKIKIPIYGNQKIFKERKGNLLEYKIRHE